MHRHTTFAGFMASAKNAQNVEKKLSKLIQFNKKYPVVLLHNSIYKTDISLNTTKFYFI